MTDHEFKAPERTSNEAEWLQAIRRELADFTIHNGGPLGLCEVSVTDADGSDRPCGRDVFGYSWYEGGEHEPLLSMTCMEHSNEAGGLIAGLYWTAYDLLERATRLTVERDRARALAARLEAQVAQVQELAGVAVCAGCPVQAECLAEAIRSDARHGVWGGLSEHARGRLPAATRARLAG